MYVSVSSIPSASFFTLLRVDGLQHHGNAFHLIAGCDGKHVAVKMYGTTLMRICLSIRKYAERLVEHIIHHQ